MAIKFMTRVFIEEYDQIIKNEAYEFEETLVNQEEGDVIGDTIIIPDNIRIISLTVDTFVGGKAKIETTTNKLEDVRSNTNVVWVDWGFNEVSDPTQTSLVPVTAIRHINVEETTNLSIRAQ